ncbi:hypothetical protein Tco_0613206 [Tanacetum coccineum]
MANLDFCDKHNMVAFLKKPEGSEGFHQIVDFLNSTHIKYALTESPIIYVSLIHQFWQTASASTSENGEMGNTASIVGRVKTYYDASIRRHTQARKFLMINFSKGALFPSIEGKGSTVPVESHHTPTSAPSTSQPPTSPPSMQTTHVAEVAATIPRDLPLPRVYLLGSDEGSMTLHELTVLCTTLSKKVESLESDLKQTKMTYGSAYTKLIMKIGAQTQGRHEHDLEPDFEFTAPEEVSTASPEVKTAVESLMCIKRSAAKRKDKGKAIMKEVPMGRIGKSLLKHTGFKISNHRLVKFDKDDLDKLWSLVKERFSSTDPTNDKERTLWVELKRLLEPNIDDILWKLQRYMHDPLTWRLYDTCDPIQVDSSLVVPYFLPTDDPLECLNKALTFMSNILALSYPSSNNQLEISSNPMYQVVMLERQTLSYVGNCSTGERIDFGLGAFTVTTNALFQADGVEVYDSDCDDVPNAQPSFMDNISSYGSDALVEVHNPDNVDNNMINQGVQVMPSSKQSNVANHSETEITSDINIIPYSQQVTNCTKINLDNKSVNDSLTAELERYKEQVKVLKKGQNVDLKSKDNVLDSCEQSVEIDRLKQILSEHVKEKESLMQTVTLLKNDFKKEESRKIDKEIALEKKIKQLDNIIFKRDQSAQTVHMLTKPQFFYDHTTKQALCFQNPFYMKKAQQLEPKLYDGNVIKNTSAIVIPDSESC